MSLPLNPYGGYGGVCKTAKYIPPTVPDYIPQPASFIFNTQHRQEIQAFFESYNSANLTDYTTFITENSANIVLRYLTSTNKELSSVTFTMYTTAHPEDKITYTASSSSIFVNLFDIDGGKC